MLRMRLYLYSGNTQKVAFSLAYFLCLFCDFTYGLAFSYKAAVICVTVLFTQWM